MEIKNTTPYTYDLLMEFNRQHQRKLMTAMTVIICAFAGLSTLALIAGLILYASLGGNPIPPSDFVIPVVYDILAVFLLLWPHHHRKKVCTRQADLHTVVELTFTEEGFSEDSTSDIVNGHRDCRYAVVTKVTESEHAFYLYINPNAAHIVSKDGFAEGTENDFRLLLRTVIDPKKLRIR